MKGKRRTEQQSDATTANRQNQSAQHRSAATDDQPNGSLIRFSGNTAGEFAAEGLGRIESENQQNNAECKNGQSSDVVHIARPFHAATGMDLGKVPQLRPHSFFRNLFLALQSNDRAAQRFRFRG